ncbi:MAG: hypothetical protein Q9222_005514 [Ikaeria aurantiellina]
MAIQPLYLYVVLVQGSLVGHAPPPPPGFPPLEINEEGITKEETANEYESDDEDDENEPDEPEESAANSGTSQHTTTIPVSHQSSIPSTASAIAYQTTFVSSSRPMPTFSTFSLSTTTANGTFSISTTGNSTQSSVAPTEASQKVIEYLIYPKDGKDNRNSAVTEDLKSTYGAAMDMLTVNDTGIIFWLAPLKAVDVERYQTNTLVQAIALNEVLDRNFGTYQNSFTISPSNKLPRRRHGIEGRSRGTIGRNSSSLNRSVKKRDGIITVQEDVGDLALLSTSPTHDTVASQEYVYDSKAGQGITIYSFDSGTSSG